MNTTSDLTRLEGRRVVAWTVSAYPVILLISLYSTWLLAWLSVGHQPRPYQDDPKYVNWLVTLFYSKTLLLLMGCYVALLLNGIIVLIEVVQKVRRRQWDFVLLVIVPVVLWLCLFLLIDRDPGKIGVWFFD
jgi:hypothetical protein